MWALTLYRSTIGKKIIMAVTGLVLVAFVIAHMAGNLQQFLLDVLMPELDGCETTRRIRALRRSKTRPWIIALTAGAMQGDRERAFVAGMNDFVAKPVRAEALSEALFKAHAVLAVEGNSDRPSDA